MSRFTETKTKSKLGGSVIFFYNTVFIIIFSKTFSNGLFYNDLFKMTFLIDFFYNGLFYTELCYKKIFYTDY